MTLSKTSGMRGGERAATDPDGVRDEIAIVGMACTFPGARTAAEFWQNIVNGVDAVTDVSPARWDPAVFYDPNPATEDRIYCKKGGWIGDSFAFNPVKFGIMPRTVPGSEPDHFLVLRTVHEALEDAGYRERPLDGTRVSVILGKGNYLGPGVTALMYRGVVTEQTLAILKGLHPEFTEEHLREIRSEVRARLPEISADVAAGLIPNICTGRVANRFDFLGRNFTIDAACASSLIATEMAVHDLREGRADMVLAGGVHIFAHIPFLQVFDAMQALSLSSVIQPFDEDCDGTIPGEGVGVLVLKRLSDVEPDFDRVYALIKGVGSSSDGRAKGVTAPRVEGEELALRRAYEMAEVAPQSVGLIEAHGTGTPVGDAAEVQALRNVFGASLNQRPTCAVGSIKSMIGHAMPAAGAAGMIKAALALYHRVLPPTIHCRTPRKDLVQGDSPFYVNTETRPWIEKPKGAPRRAGVNAFGFGGINAHVVLEEYRGRDEKQPSLLRDWETELVVLEAESRELLIAEVDGLRGYALNAKGVRLRDVAFTRNSALGRGEHRLSVVATTLEDLGSKLAAAQARLADSQVNAIKDRRGIYFFAPERFRGGKLALVFPGEGSQYINMLLDLVVHFPAVRRSFELADSAARADRTPTSDVVFPPSAWSQEQARAAEERLFRIDRATEAVLTADGAIFKLLSQFGVRADMMAGHSAGEWVAMAASGVLHIDEFVASMGRLGAMYEKLAGQTEIPSMSMLAVGAGRERIERLLDGSAGRVYIANDNCPHQVVVVVHPGDEQAVSHRLHSSGVFVERLPYDRGYHTEAFTYICQPLREYFSSMEIRPPRTPLYSCTTAAPFPAEPGEMLDLVSTTFTRPLLFRQTVEAMYQAGATLFVEAGPRGNLTAFIDDILRGKPHLAVAVDQYRRPGLTALHHALALIAAAGVELDLGPLYQHRAPRELSFDPRRDRVEDIDSAPGTVQISTCYPRLVPPKALETRFRVASSSRQAQEGLGKNGGDSEREGAALPARLAPALRDSSPGHALPEDGRGLSVVGENGGLTPRVDAPNVVREHFAIMEQFLDTENDVMYALLAAGGGARPIPLSPKAVDLAAPAAAPAEASVPRSEPISEAALVAVSKPSAVLEEALIEIVSDRTGYPPEMLDLDVDIEADLGIDSIKRVEIFSALQQGNASAGLTVEADVEILTQLKTLRQVLEYLNGVNGGKTPSPIDETKSGATEPKLGPFVGGSEILSHVAGRSLSLRTSLNLEEHLYLNDHCLYFPGSDFDNQAPPLLSMPMSGSLEMMAEAAALLCPGLRVVGARGVQALRWINAEKGAAPSSLFLQAERRGHERVHVRILSTPEPAAGDEAGPGATLAEAEILFADRFPAVPPDGPPPPPLDNPREPATSGPGIYSERRMFHGPSFQGVVSLDALGDNGFGGWLEVLPTEGLFRSDGNPRFHIDPFLLDAAGQMVGHWPVETLAEGFVALPIRLSELTLYRENLKPGARARCEVRIRTVGPRQLRADMYVFDAAGGLWMRVAGWEDWRFYWERHLYEFWRFAKQRFNGVNVDLPERGGVSDVEIRSIEPGAEMDRTGLWEDIWMRMILTRREMDEYRGITDRARRTNWSFEKAAVKDAVRAWVKRLYGSELFPADVEVETDEKGHPLASGPWLQPGASRPRLAVAWHGKAIVAAASSTEIGLAITSLTGSSENGALDSRELRLLSGLTGEPEEWRSRARLAKRAAAGLLSEDSETLAIQDVRADVAEFKVMGAVGRGALVRSAPHGTWLVALARPLGAR